MKRILISNDDGIHAPGIRKLIEAAGEFGEITVVAPDNPRSGVGHAITLNSPLRMQEVSNNDRIREYACSGTPVDCVKMGLKLLFGEEKPDLILSGINHGSNASSNVIYSGTMGAALEGAIEKIPSIGFSLLDFSHRANFDESLPFVKEIIRNTLENGLPANIALNVNIPNIKNSEIQGIKVCKQANAYWEESYEERRDPFHNQYYWLSGHFIDEDPADNSDLKALNEHYIAVVPVHFDLTAYAQMTAMNDWLSKLAIKK